MFEDFSSWKIQVLMARALLRKHVWTDPCSVGTQWPGRHTTERSKALGYKLTAHCTPHFGWIMTQEWLVIKLSFHINTWQSAFVPSLGPQIANARFCRPSLRESQRWWGDASQMVLGCSSHLESPIIPSLSEKKWENFRRASAASKKTPSNRGAHPSPSRCRGGSSRISGCL